MQTFSAHCLFVNTYFIICVYFFGMSFLSLNSLTELSTKQNQTPCFGKFNCKSVNFLYCQHHQKVLYFPCQFEISIRIVYPLLLPLSVQSREMLTVLYIISSPMYGALHDFHTSLLERGEFLYIYFPPIICILFLPCRVRSLQ